MNYRIIIILLLGSVSILPANAQKDRQFQFSAGPEIALPVGSFSNGYSFGIGATGQVEVGLSEHVKGTATAGIVFYNGKSIGNGLKNTGINIIPLRIGAKYYLTNAIYGNLQAGVGLINKGIGTAFAYSPQVGYEFQSKNGRSLDISFKYDGYVKNGTLAAVGLRIALVL